MITFILAVVAALITIGCAVAAARIKPDSYSSATQMNEALAEYRAAMGIDAKLVVLATTSSNFTIALPDDPGMLDIAGFDLTVPQVIAGFAQE